MTLQQIKLNFVSTRKVSFTRIGLLAKLRTLLSNFQYIVQCAVSHFHVNTQCILFSMYLAFYDFVFNVRHKICGLEGFDNRALWAFCKQAFLTLHSVEK